jgi:hypothetical protein
VNHGFASELAGEKVDAARIAPYPERAAELPNAA